MKVKLSMQHLLDLTSKQNTTVWADRSSEKIELILDPEIVFAYNIEINGVLTMAFGTNMNHSQIEEATSNQSEERS